MASSDEKPEYPRRLYEPGKAPFLNHSMNHNCYLTNLGFVKECLGDKIWESLQQSSVGVILKLASKEFVFSAITVHHLLTNQLQTTKPHEIWSLIGDEPIRFSMHEFSTITDLNCSPFDAEDKLDLCHNDFWKEMDVNTCVGPRWLELENVLTRCSTWTDNKKKMLGLLCVLSIGIYGISKRSRIPLEAAKRVLDLDAFERYPWGRVAFDSLINGVKVVTFERDSYVVKGFVQVLQIWAYESVKVLGENFGIARDELDLEPLLRWKGSRKRFKLPEILEKEMKTHGKVRVRNMFVQSPTELYPQWDDDLEDTKVDNLIQDLVHDRYCRSFYSVVEVKKLGKRKARTQNSPCKKNAKGIEGVEERTTFTNDKEVPTRPEQVPIGREKEKDPVVAEVVKEELAKMLNEFGKTLLTSVEANIGKTMLSFEDSLREKVAADQAVRSEAYVERLEKMESMIADINKRVDGVEFKEIPNVMAKDNKKAESSSKNPSWLAYKVQTSEEKFPIARAVKKKSKVTTNNEVTSKLRVAPTHKDLTASAFSDDKKDIELSDTDKTPQEKAMDNLFDSLIDICGAKVGVEDKRRVQRAKSQVHPFVGNSTVKRLIPEAVIDPLSLVKDSSLRKLMDFIKENELTPIGRNIGMKFVRLMTPKKSWSKKDPGFGWLHDILLKVNIFIMSAMCCRVKHISQS